MSSITSALAANINDLALEKAKSIAASPDGASLRDIASHSQATTGHAANAKDVGQQFEAMYLRQMLDEMMPKDTKDLFGNGTAGSMWRSMMVDTLSTALSKTGSIGIAHMIEKTHGSDTKGTNK